MTQTRIVLRPKDAPTIDQIIETTGVGSASDAVALLISRYGQALINWWTSDPHQCQYSPAAAASELPSPSIATIPSLEDAQDLPPISF